ncbi:Cytochrome B pre-mRNA-processing protein 6 [Cyberlindnera fabianii]|uniref:Cytochrome B pre-mRNA-processing protein 6 n=1 Tax=Cyberlindnera fabianii TaxID=36022 RepID=A0A1V2KZD2_CYBFA|nr:Cytochrome B pre-mRNA-processing protein 6 [Cyberlindnera fabianii]
MSAVKETAKLLVQTLESFPKEKLTDLSFKEVQLERFRPVAGLANPTKTKGKTLVEIVKEAHPYAIKDIEISSDENFAEESLVQQIKSLRSIQSNQYRDYYYVTDKLLKPAGNPGYYDRLLAEINGEGKENLMTGLRTVLLGK